MERVELAVKGMHCENCVTSVTEALKAIHGVKLARVSLENERADVTYDPAKTSLQALKEAVEAAGYQVAS